MANRAIAAIASSLDRDLHRAEAALAVGQRAAQDVLDRRLRQRLQHEHLRPREQRRVHLERGVLGGRADQDDVAGFDAGKKGILLRLVEAMDLVDEDDRPPARRAAAHLRRPPSRP